MIKKNFTIFSILITILLIFSFYSCATTDNGYNNFESNTKQNKKEKLKPIQKKLVQAAETYVGSNNDSLVADNKTYNLDCSGAMLAIYYKAGIYLEKCYSGYDGNGVKRLYYCLKDHKLLTDTKLPEPGDLIFWDNTYDRNGDGKFNDYFSHTGMVVDVKKDGTITYIHDNYRKGLVYAKMNLKHPHDREINSPMRMRGSPPAPNNESLASELIRVFGRAWLLPKSYFR
ncbi:MAG: CHAP domain-containing protein [Spirochaetales bacterium]|nr:CHAP domain-containing protein [Spirochaetales bacterium]